MKHACISTLVALVFACAPLAPALADDAAALTTSIQALDGTAATRSPGAVSGKIASDFRTFAGSGANSTNLVEGLRSGSTVTLTAPNQPSATFTPPTRPMGWGNVSTSLALAQYQLGQQGITSPTPLQLQTALNGGAITANGQTVQYQGVLQMRASGMGWGEIAQASGTKLGPVISSVKTQSAAVSTLPATQPATAAGVTSASGRGLVSGNGAVSTGKAEAPGQAKTASGAAQGKGIVTASGGAGNGVGNGHGASAKGQGIVTGQGVVTAGGASATAAGNAGGAKGLTTAGDAGGGAGNGKALGHTK